MALAYRLKLTMDQLDYPVWRTVVVPEDLTLEKLLEVFKTLFSWPMDEAASLNLADSPWEDAVLKDIGTSLGLGEYFKLAYPVFLCGKEQWRHRIQLEEIIDSETAMHYARCIAGEGHRPPREVGGVSGYKAFLCAVENVNHPKHYQSLEWAEKDTGGRMFDKKYFYILEVNRQLKRL